MRACLCLLLLVLLALGCREKSVQDEALPSAAEPSKQSKEAPSRTWPPQAPESTKAEAERDEHPNAAFDGDTGPDNTPLPDSSALHFTVDKGGLWVKWDKGEAALGERASSLKSVKKDNKSVTIRWVDEISCALDKERTFTVDYIHARLENTRGFRLYKKNDFRHAATAFRRATLLDPEYQKPFGNLVSAHARAGDLKRASAAFDWALRWNAVYMYEKLLSDPDFLPLQDSKRLKAVAPPRIFSTQGEVLPPYAGYSKKFGLVVVLRTEVSWGSENWTAVLHLLDQQSKRQLSEQTLVDWGDTLEEGGFNPRRRQDTLARLRRYEEVLSALGFVALPKDRHARFENIDKERPVREATLNGFSSSLVANPVGLRLVQGDSVLQEWNPKLTGEAWASVPIPEMNRLVYQAQYMVSEGCDSGPETRFELLELKSQLRGGD